MSHVNDIICFKSANCAEKRQVSFNFFQGCKLLKSSLMRLGWFRQVHGLALVSWLVESWIRTARAVHAPMWLGAGSQVRAWWRRCVQLPIKSSSRLWRQLKEWWVSVSSRGRTIWVWRTQSDRLCLATRTLSPHCQCVRAAQRRTTWSKASRQCAWTQSAEWSHAPTGRQISTARPSWARTRLNRRTWRRMWRHIHRRLPKSARAAEAAARLLLLSARSSAASANITGSPSWSTGLTGWRTRPGTFFAPTCGSTCVPCAGPRGPRRTPSASAPKWTARTAPCTSEPDAEVHVLTTRTKNKTPSSLWVFIFY